MGHDPLGMGNWENWFGRAGWRREMSGFIDGNKSVV